VEDIMRSYNLHANAHVTKPVELKQFLQVIRAIEDFWLAVVTLPPANGKFTGKRDDSRKCAIS